MPDTQPETTADHLYGTPEYWRARVNVQREAVAIANRRVIAAENAVNAARAQVRAEEDLLEGLERLAAPF